MIKKIVHISDIHVRKYDRHEEYVEIFKKLAKSIQSECKGLKKDEIRIVVCGDIAHQKNNISPELTIMLFKLFTLFDKLGKTIIIAGNHDYLVSNKDRMDCITPVIEMGNFKNVYFLDKLLNYESGYMEDDNICWALYSSFSDFSCPPNLDIYKEEKPDKKIIGLFHGSVVGAKLDNGTTMENGVDTNTFKDCDVVLAGHIHKMQEMKQNGVKIVYAGSLIQQDMGETVSNHGYLLWDVETMEYKHIQLLNDYAMYKIEINSIEDIDDDLERYLNL